MPDDLPGLVELDEFHADNFRSLEAGVSKALEANPSLLVKAEHSAGLKVCIRVSSFRSTLFHEKAVAERIRQLMPGIYGCDLESCSEISDSDTQLIVVHIVKDRVSLKIDSSGMHLHKRGYGKHTEAAPLRETICAAMLYASFGSCTRQDMLDPLCGSGTIALEAALLKKQVTWDAFRGFTFMKWNGYQDALLERVKANTPFPPLPHPQGNILASDADPKAIATLMHNARLSGTEDLIQAEVKKLADYHDQDLKNYCVVCNPPWDKRIQLKRKKALYAELNQLVHSGAELYLIHPQAQKQYLEYKLPLFSCKSGDIDLLFHKVVPIEGG